MVNDVLELVGFLLVLAFCVIVWWPAAVLVAGLGLIAAALARDRSARRPVDGLERRRIAEAERRRAVS